MTTPASGAVGIAVDAVLTASFSEPVNTTTLNTSSVTVAGSGSAAPVTGTVTVTGTTATFTPAAPLSPSTTYTVTISTAVKDVAGNALASTYVWSFTTAAPPDVTAPTIVSRTPSPEATQVALSVKPSVTFSEPMRSATLSTATITLTNAGTGTPVPGTISVSGDTATFVPTAALEPTTQYTMRVLTGVQDLAGNALNAPATWAFRTLTPASVDYQYPANGAIGVPQDIAVTAGFSEAIDPATLTPSTFMISGPGGGAVSGIVVVNVTNNAAIFYPDSRLAANTQYTVTVKSTVRTATGNALGQDFTWTLTTETTAPDNTPPEVSFTSPQDGNSGIDIATSITVLMTERMSNPTINTASVTIAPASGGTPLPAAIALFGLRFVVTPSSPLLPNTRYTVSISTDVKDVAGNALAAAYRWSFTTAP